MVWAQELRGLLILHNRSDLVTKKIGRDVIRPLVGEKIGESLEDEAESADLPLKVMGKKVSIGLRQEMVQQTVNSM
jgi:hypothetical protein